MTCLIDLSVFTDGSTDLGVHRERSAAVFMKGNPDDRFRRTDILGIRGRALATCYETTVDGGVA